MTIVKKAKNGNFEIFENFFLKYKEVFPFIVGERGIRKQCCFEAILYLLDLIK